MHIPKKYFHDKAVLLLLSINTFLTLLCTALILYRLDFSRPDGYIVQYRANLGLNAFRGGEIIGILAFVAFAVAVLVFHVLLSMRVYRLRRHFSIAVLGLAVLLLSTAIIVSNALLEI